MSNPSVSIVVPLYNDAATIEACLEALLRQESAEQCEIVVVDDGSTDDGPERAARYPMTLVRKANGGPAAARNAGAARARGELIIFIDADCIASTGWLKGMVAPFAETDVVAVMGAIDSASSETVPQLLQLEIDERYRRLARTRYVDFFASAVVAFRRGLFTRIGGFREDFRYNEDVELAYRIHREGGKIVFNPSAPVTHLHQNTWRAYFWMKFWRGVWRMRVYRLYPRQAVSDSWTPQSLKLQVVLAALLPAAVVVGMFLPDAFWFAGGLGLVTVGATHSFIVDAYRKSGWRTALSALPYLWVRAVALGSAIVWNMLVPWKPAEMQVLKDRKI